MKQSQKPHTQKRRTGHPAKEDTLCHDSLTEAERKWLRVNRPPEAAHWNLLTDMKAENLPHGRP